MDWFPAQFSQSQLVLACFFAMGIGFGIGGAFGRWVERTYQEMR